VTARVFTKLILAVLGVLAVALAAVNLLVTPRVRESLLAVEQRELTDKAHTAELLLPRDQSSFAALGTALGARITWIAKDGHVLGDSESDPSTMENHAQRPEVASALAGGVGTSIRSSATIATNFYYLAIPHEGGVLRLAVPTREIDERVSGFRTAVMLGTALAFIPAFLLAAIFARSVSGRLGQIIEFSGELAKGNFRARLKTDGRGELGVLATKLNETAEKLAFMMKRLEDEQAEMETLERVRKDFIMNVSHELRTPLASIQGYTETLLDGAVYDSPHNLKFLNIIRQNAERLARLTADLLVLSRIEMGQQKFKFAFYTAQGLLEENVDSIRPLAAAKGIKLILEPAPPNSEVFCDAEAFLQTLSNLLENAIKYTAEGGTVTVGARPIKSEEVEFFVKDTGMGIPAEDLPRLFERFYRVDKARSRSLGGTGLGLAIVKHLARAQGGDVRVESKVDRGSTFFFTLPVHDLGLAEQGAIQKELASQS
jgi:two-component system phosphate regulon sensor histidine kinase PhoR